MSVRVSRQTLPYVDTGGPVVLAFVLHAYAYAHGRACRTRVNMHVCVCNARRLLLPVSSLHSAWRAHSAKANFAVSGKLDG